MISCFPLGKMTGLTNSQIMKYSYAVYIFRRVEDYNARVRLERLAGDLTKSYYIFENADEKSKYILGLSLLTQNDPAYADYVPVEKI
jgi:hypothetical protein